MYAQVFKLSSWGTVSEIITEDRDFSTFVVFLFNIVILIKFKFTSEI